MSVLVVWPPASIKAEVTASAVPAETAVEMLLPAKCAAYY